MITFLLGLPGSGKSYYAVDRIFNNFSDDEEAKRDKKTTFKNCYTNINQFKFDKVNNTYNLDLDVLYKILVRLHGHYKNKKDDKFLLRFLSLVKLKDTLIVIDEAHNFFDSENKVLVWWLSYHRHLHHEIILITQNHTLISAKYKAFSEFFYVAKPSSLRLFKTHFKYNIYTASRQTKANNVGDKKIKLNDKVFALYHSGDSVDVKNLVLKYILISLAIFVSLIVFFYFFISNKSNKDELPNSNAPEKNSVTFQQKEHVTQQDDKTDYENYINKELNKRILFSLSCSISKCSNEKISIPPQLLKVFIDNKSLKVLYSQKVNKKLVNYYIDSSIDFYNYLIPQKEDNNEELKNSNSNKLDLDFLPTSK
jgi:zona occludens toxin